MDAFDRRIAESTHGKRRVEMEELDLDNEGAVLKHVLDDAALNIDNAGEELAGGTEEAPASGGKLSFGARPISLKIVTIFL